MELPISIKKLHPKRFAIFWNRDARVLLIGLYFYTVGIDFGLKESNWYKHFFKTCQVCGKELPVRHRLQLIRFHKECRRQGRRLIRQGKIILKNG